MNSVKFKDRPPFPRSASLVPALCAVLLCFAGHAAAASPQPAATAASPASPALSVWEKPQVLDGIWKFHYGDSSAWALAGYKDAHWDSVLLTNGLGRKTVLRNGHAWYRLGIRLPSGPGPGKSLGLLHPAITPQEYYWDGELIGRTGRIGASQAEERAGDVSLTQIPDRLSGPGMHILAIRLSARHPVFHPNPMHVTLGETTALELGSAGETMAMFLLAGVFVFGAVYRFLNYRAAGYGRNTILFSIFVLSCAAYIVLQYLGSVVDLIRGAGMRKYALKVARAGT